MQLLLMIYFARYSSVQSTESQSGSVKIPHMSSGSSKLSNWSPEQLALGKRWVRTWKDAAPQLERVRREELRRLDSEHAIALLCGELDYKAAPRASRPTSGLVEQQRWFMKAACRD